MLPSLKRADSHNIDLLVKPGGVERGIQALANCGMRTERPPEGWLVKAFDGDVMIDLIHSPAGVEVDDALLSRADERSVDGMRTSGSCQAEPIKESAFGRSCS